MVRLPPLETGRPRRRIPRRLEPPSAVTQVRPGLRLGERRQQELTTERVFDHHALGIARCERDHDAGKIRAVRPASRVEYSMMRLNSPARTCRIERLSCASSLRFRHA